MSRKQNYISIVTIIILTAVLTLLLSKALSGDLMNPRMQIDPSSEDWEPDRMPENAGQIQIPGYETIAFCADETAQEITLYNPKENSCLFRFTLSIEGEEETPIYESDLVEPGSAIQRITLNRPLSEGDYRLNIHIDTYDITTDQPLNSAVSSAELSVH